MEMIEKLLRDCGERVEYATVWRDGVRRRVTPAEAYAPDVAIGEGLRGGRETAYMVECAPAVLVGSSFDGIDWAGVAVKIDHHRPGDPGYGRPPAEFLPASSIGQVIAELARLGRLPQWPPARTTPGDGAGAYVLHAWAPDPASWDEDLGEWRGGDTPPPSWAVSVQSDDIRAAIYRLVPQSYICAAAADHCLAAAYRGECPGVDPDALMRWRVEQRAAHQGRSVEEVLADVERAREALRAAPTVQLADGIDARDMREAYTVQTVLVVPFTDGASVDAAGVGDSKFVVFGPRAEGAWDEGGHHTFVEHGVPELPEAAAREGVCFVARLPGPGGRTKIVCQSGTAAQIDAFMRVWAPANGLTDIYGDPARGFAGGYMMEPSSHVHNTNADS